MKRILPTIAIMLLLAGCSSSTPDHTPKPRPSHSVSMATIPHAAPACSSMVGKPTSEVIPYAKDGPRCITGTSVDTDNTGFITTNCDPVSNTSTIVFGWTSQDPSAPDQKVYAAKVGGIVVIVPNGDEFKAGIGVTVASYLQAVGCP